MNNEQMINCLENMAERMVKFFENGEDFEADAQLAQAYAQICTAIAALNAPKPFIQIGNEIIRKDDIVRAVIFTEEQRYSNERSVAYKMVKLTLRELDTDEGYGSSSVRPEYDLDSPEGQALLGWLQGQSEVLIAYEEPAQGKDEEDEEPPYALTAPFDDGIVQAEPAYPCVCGDSSCSGCF